MKNPVVSEAVRLGQIGNRHRYRRYLAQTLSPETRLKVGDRMSGAVVRDPG
jgi:hypothetical protein